MDFAYPYDEALNCSDIIHQMKGEERDVNILPFYGLN